MTPTDPQPPLPQFQDPAEAAHANRILERRPNQPYGHTDAAGLRPARREEITKNVVALDSHRSWHFLGLLYTVVGLDRSAFDLCGVALNRDLSVVSHQAPSPLIDFAPIQTNPWSATVQGIPHEDDKLFTEHLCSYVFRDGKLGWSVVPKTINIADPFLNIALGVKVTFWLPVRTDGVCLRFTKLAGLSFDRPAIEIVRART